MAKGMLGKRRWGYGLGHGEGRHGSGAGFFWRYSRVDRPGISSRIPDRPDRQYAHAFPGLPAVETRKSDVRVVGGASSERAACKRFRSHWRRGKAIGPQL